MNFLKTTLLTAMATVAVAQTVQAKTISIDNSILAENLYIEAAQLKDSTRSFLEEHTALIRLSQTNQPEALEELDRDLQELLADNSKQIVFLSFPGPFGGEECTAYCRQAAEIIKKANATKPVIMLQHGFKYHSFLSSEMNELMAKSITTRFHKGHFMTTYGVRNMIEQIEQMILDLSTN